MKKRLYRMACTGIAVGIIGSTVSAMAYEIGPSTKKEIVVDEKVEMEEVELNAGVSRVFSELMNTTTYEMVETVEISTEEANPYEPFNYEDAYLLGKIAMAEAEGEDIEGKALVIQTVLNRVSSSEFPNSIKEVIYQENQFTPIIDGRFDRVEPNDDCWEAFFMVVNADYDISQESLYFESCKNSDNWHSRNLQFLFQHGNSNFYK